MHKTNDYVKIFSVAFCAYCVWDVALTLANVVPYLHDGSMELSSIGSLAKGFFLNHIAQLLVFCSILFKNRKVGIVGAIAGLLKSIYDIINMIMKPYTPFFLMIFGFDIGRGPSISKIVSTVCYLIVFLLILILMLGKKNGKIIGVILAVILGFSNLFLRIYVYGFGGLRLGSLLLIVLKMGLYFLFALAWECLFKENDED